MVKNFTIFGNPVEHSISPQMHTFAIEGLKLDATYDKTHLEDATKLRDMFINNYDGANITVPHKEAAYQICDEIRGIAKEIKAVNTIINENGKIVGYNTDAPGFLKSIESFGKIKTVLILGGGGTAKALSIIFQQNGIDVTILNRSKNRLDFFEKRGIKTFSWDDFVLSHYDLVVNTTSAGLQDESLPIAEETMNKIFKNSKYAVDVIYNKETPFLKLATKLGIPNKDGADMLLYQGVLAFDLFYDHAFEVDEITKYMKQNFQG